MLNKYIAAALLIIIPAVYAVETSVSGPTAQQLNRQVDTSTDTRLQDLTNRLEQAGTELSRIETCNNNKRIYAPADSRADSSGCKTLFQFPRIEVSARIGDVIRTTRSRPLIRNLGVHDFCVLSGISGPGGLDTNCIVRQTTDGSGNWELFTSDYTSAETHACYATCFQLKY